MEPLQQALETPGFRDADACVILSNHFVRYALVPWSEHLVADDEKRAWVAHHFAELYGEPAAAVDYRWSEGKRNSACVACAIDSELITQVRSIVGSSSLRLRSVQPYLMAAFNRCRRAIDGKPVWIAVPENGRVCMATFAGGEWRTLSSRNVGPDWQTDLAVMLERQMLFGEDDEEPVVIAYAPGLTTRDVASIEKPIKVLTPKALAGYTPYSDAGCAMALAGVL